LRFAVEFVVEFVIIEQFVIIEPFVNRRDL